ncbi:tyrosine-type recombinase/integrase [Ornithinibacillus contaminans]|uniref:tyrosine-type recombinase/integrase n=1 Tax=Ornithinibacillus contaminans TaxID=694055 RepID=UPI00064DDFF9|nr:tyrosine-type recombinase/integrase [Ornithinibacillus contaminans]
MKVEKTLTSFVLVDTNMRIIPEVLDYTTTLELNGMSPNTVRGYLNDLKIFYMWLEQKRLRFFEVRPKHLTSFIEYVDNRNIKGRVSPPTLNRYLATLGSFYRHFEATGGFVEESPVVKIKGYEHKQRKGYFRHTTKNWDNNLHNYFRRKHKKKRDKKRLYEKDVDKCYEMIETLWNGDVSLKFRNKLIFNLLYETGYRVSELLHLKIDDYDYPDPTEKTGNLYLIERDNESLDRQLKTGERTIPVSIRLLQDIDDYILYHRPDNDGADYIFVSHSRANLGEPIGRSSIETVIQDIESKCDFKYIKLTPHSLRHTHSSELQDLGVDINIIKDRLGHASIETTAKYTEPSIQTKIMAYERFLDSKKGVLSNE